MKKTVTLAIALALVFGGVAYARPKVQHRARRPATVQAVTRVEAESVIATASLAGVDFDRWVQGSGPFFSAGVFVSGPGNGTVVGTFTVPPSATVAVRFGVDGNGHYPLTALIRVDDGAWVPVDASGGTPDSALNPYRWWSTYSVSGLGVTTHTVEIKTTSYQMPSVDYFDVQ